MRRLLAAAVLFLALASPTAAGTVRVSVHDTMGDVRPDVNDFSRIRFDAAPGERNQVFVLPAGPGALRTRDDGARLQVGNRCTRLSAHSARCEFVRRYPFDRKVQVNLGDRDDRYRNRAALQLVYRASGDGGDDELRGNRRVDVLGGGAGDDRLRGGAEGDVVDGGPGADHVLGGAGKDLVLDGRGLDLASGGGGDDVLASTDAGRPVGDRFIGGAGTDVLRYTGRKATITGRVGATSGVRGERDVMISVEGLRGGQGDDVLRGTTGADLLAGGDGSDRLFGGAGPDRLDSGSGDHDRVFGGPGADRLLAPCCDDRHPDVHCGPGRDVNVVGDIRTLLRPDCERVANGGRTLPAQPLRTTGAAVVMQVPCATVDRPKFRAVRLLARDGSTVAAGERAFDRSKGASCRVRLALTADGTQLDRPSVVRVKLRYYPTWSFVLR